MDKLYCIALLPDEAFRAECLKYKLEAKSLFATKVALKMPAHITIVAPFKADLNLVNTLDEILKYEVIQHKAFNLKILGWSFFRKQTIYIAVEKQLKLAKFQLAINAKLAVFVNLMKKQDFIPHITIINRDLLVENFAAALRYFSSKKLEKVIYCRKLALFEHQDKEWKIVKSYSLPAN